MQCDTRMQLNAFPLPFTTCARKTPPSLSTTAIHTSRPLTSAHLAVIWDVIHLPYLPIHQLGLFLQFSNIDYLLFDARLERLCGLSRLGTR